MEMMPMIMNQLDDQLPQQFPFPFQYQPGSSFIEFSGPTPLPQRKFINRYPVAEPEVFTQRVNSTYREFPLVNCFQQDVDSVEAMREMVFQMAALQPVEIDPESIKPVKRRNVKISTDPQTVAARHRRERISERIRILQRLVPGGTKMDTASMLDEAAHYMKFLKKQVQSLELAAAATGDVMPTKTSPPPGVNIVGCCPTSTTNATINHYGTNNHSRLVRICGQHAT